MQLKSKDFVAGARWANDQARKSVDRVWKKYPDDEGPAAQMSAEIYEIGSRIDSLKPKAKK